MIAFNKFFSAVFLAVLCATYGNAAPSPTGSKHSTHRVRSLDNGLTVELFHPSSSYQTFGQGLDLPSSLVGLDNADQTVSFVSSQLQMDSKNIAFKSGYTSNDGVTFGYAKQSHNGIPFINAVANVAFKDNKAVAFGSSFVPISMFVSSGVSPGADYIVLESSDKIADSSPTVDINTVIPKVEEVLQGKKNEIEPTLEYLALEDGSSALVHVFQVQDEMNSWYEAYADAHTGELVSVTDFVAKASVSTLWAFHPQAQNLPSPNHHEQYRALPAWKQDIREGLQYLLNPEDEEVSPKGWLSGNRTEGNNVVSFKGNQDATSVANRRQLGLVFDYTYDPAKAPTEGDNLDAARVNAFYIANTYHDVLYRYGFTEEAFNYQTDSFGKGKGGDPVLLSVQDASGTNDAKFFHTPDGQPGRCLMFIFTATRPARDGVMQNDILIHELTHGLTNRMTGGGTARCLQTLEARGLGEGWSDAVADWFAQSDNVSIVDFTTGNWVLNNAGGVRSKPYSTSTAVNDKKYSTIAGLNEEHCGDCSFLIVSQKSDLLSFQISERANTLHNVLAELVLARGVSKNALTDASSTTGNVVYLNLLVKGLAIQPCNPTFLDARDAIIQADQNLYGGANKCLLWKTFASRGLGVGAKDYRDSSDVPKECQDDVV
ncbi:hypothetical protein AAF712_010523 [Marasmius tenuissimus]|uniref:Extracellular metalloproteinase n=1 Tax=Marasmius tenuissimus TaxID=585030 RepID=A0ABR2ZNT6_9AGAR